MKVIGRDEFDQAKPKDVPPTPALNVDSEAIQNVLSRLDNPVELQKEVAAQLHIALINRMQTEISKNGVLSDATMKQISVYNNMCDSIHKNQFGELMNIGVGVKISHSQVNALLREAHEPRKTIEAEFKEEKN